MSVSAALRAGCGDVQCVVEASLGMIFSERSSLRGYVLEPAELLGRVECLTLSRRMLGMPSARRVLEICR